MLLARWPHIIEAYQFLGTQEETQLLHNWVHEGCVPESENAEIQTMRKMTKGVRIEKFTLHGVNETQATVHFLDFVVKFSMNSELMVYNYPRLESRNKTFRFAVMPLASLMKNEYVTLQSRIDSYKRENYMG